MRVVILFTVLLFCVQASAQSFNDTIYFNSGENRVVNVVKETNNALSYQYAKDNGSIRSGRSRKSMLHGYAVYDERQNLTSRHMNEQRKELKPDDPNGVAKGVGIFVGGVTAAAVVVGGVIVGGTILLYKWLSNGGG